MSRRIGVRLLAHQICFDARAHVDLGMCGLTTNFSNEWMDAGGGGDQLRRRFNLSFRVFGF